LIDKYAPALGARLAPSRIAQGIGQALTEGTVYSDDRQLIAAVMDALYRAYGIPHIEMAAIPQQIWQAMRDVG